MIKADSLSKLVLANERACFCWMVIAHLYFWANFLDAETGTLLLVAAIRTLFWLPSQENVYEEL